MDLPNNNRKLSPEERSKLMSSPEFTFRTLPDLSSSNNSSDSSDSKNSTKSTVRFSTEPVVFEDADDGDDNNDEKTQAKEEKKEKKNEEKNEITGSTFFRSFASFLQAQTSQIATVQQSTTPSNNNQDSEAQRTCQTQVIDNLLLNLEIISRIKENDKLSNQETILEIDTRVGQFFRRWFTGDSRNRTLSRIEEIVRQTIDVTQQLLEAEYDDSNKTFDEKETLLRSFETNKSEYFQKFSKNMADAIHGLNNLKKTYEYDEAIKSRIDMVIDKLTRRLGKITEKLAIRTKPN